MWIYDDQHPGDPENSMKQPTRSEMLQEEKRFFALRELSRL